MLLKIEKLLYTHFFFKSQKMSNQHLFACQYCQANFSAQHNLKYHQKTAKYCLSIQGAQANECECSFCKKIYSTKYVLQDHLKVCSEKQIIDNTHRLNGLLEEVEKKHQQSMANLVQDYEEKMETMKRDHELQIKSLEMDLAFEKRFCNSVVTYLQDFATSNAPKQSIPSTISQRMESIFTESSSGSMDQATFNKMQARIKYLENVALKRKSRVDIPEKNVVYMLTTQDHIQRRTYIIGKTKDLSSRLSGYNKTCDHIVVYYRECPSVEDMNLAESMILSKLRDYREQSNRDRFILPDDKEEDYFVSVINSCIDFVSQQH